MPVLSLNARCNGADIPPNRSPSSYDSENACQTVVNHGSTKCVVRSSHAWLYARRHGCSLLELTSTFTTPRVEGGDSRKRRTMTGIETNNRLEKPAGF